MRDREKIREALGQLDYQFEEGECLIRGWSQTERAEIKIPGQSYDIGLRQREGVYEVVADWWGVARDGVLGRRVASQEQFVGEVTQRYSYLTAVELLEESGYQVVEERDEEGEVVLEAVRYY